MVSRIKPCLMHDLKLRHKSPCKVILPTGNIFLVSKHVVLENQSDDLKFQKDNWKKIFLSVKVIFFFYSGYFWNHSQLPCKKKRNSSNLSNLLVLFHGTHF